MLDDSAEFDFRNRMDKALTTVALTDKHIECVVSIVANYGECSRTTGV